MCRQQEVVRRISRANRRRVLCALFERLEGRRLLSSTLSAGVLSVAGTRESDNVSVSLAAVSGPKVVVVENGVTQRFKIEDVSKIQISTGGGDDTINVSNETLRISFVGV